MSVHGIVGGSDVLSLDALLFRDKCEVVGVPRERMERRKADALLPCCFQLSSSRERKSEGLDC